jgi:hypothetical protein
MPDRKTTTSPSGNPIYRYEERSKPLEPAFESPDIEQLEQHIEKYIGSIDNVYHEFISDIVHVDVFAVKPTPARNHYTLITSGLSHRPMKTPPDCEPYAYAELMICLPPDWSLTDEAFKAEENYWPIRQLKILARFPHQYDAWIWYAHTISNGDPPQPFANNTKLSGIILIPPLFVPPEFNGLKIDENKTIYFLELLPLYTEEMNFKLKEGAEALFDRMDEIGVTSVVDIQRPNACKKSFSLFG